MRRVGVAERQALIGQTRDLLMQRRVNDAEQVLLKALSQDRDNADLLELIAEFYEQLQRTEDVVRVLNRCIEVEPNRSHVYFALAQALERLGRLQDVVGVYAQLCMLQPGLASAHFNRGFYLRRVGRADEAADAYRTAIDLGIDGAADAWSNLGMVLGDLERHDEARAAFARALEIDPNWVAAHYNLGLLHEEFGERAAALECFERVLAIDPDHHDAFARIVYASVGQGDDTALADRVRLRLQRADLEPVAREALSFAFGSALEACGRYDEAFDAYAAGNAIARSRVAPYDREACERELAALATRFDAQWLAEPHGVSSAPLVFVCGMWRSGTTLLERMLGAHPALTPGGEIAYFTPHTVDDALGSISGEAAEAQLGSLGQGYVALLERRFPGQRVIDKRPDTWRYLGMLHGLFPQAKFVVDAARPDRYVSFDLLPASRCGAASPTQPISATPRTICGAVVNWCATGKRCSPTRSWRCNTRISSTGPKQRSRRCAGFSGSHGILACWNFPHSAAACGPRACGRCASRCIPAPSVAGGSSAAGFAP